MEAGPLRDQLSQLRLHKVSEGSNLAVYGNVKGGNFGARITDPETLNEADRAILDGFWGSSKEHGAVAVSLMSHLETRKLVIDIDNKQAHGPVPIYPCEWLAFAEYIRRVLSDLTSRVAKLDVHLVKCGSKTTLADDKHTACSGCHIVVYNLGFSPYGAYRAVLSIAHIFLQHIGKVEAPAGTVSAATTIWKRRRTRVIVDGEIVSLGELATRKDEQTPTIVSEIVCGKTSDLTPYVSLMGTAALQYVVDNCEEIVKLMFAAEESEEHCHSVNVDEFFDVGVAYKCQIKSVFTKTRGSDGTFKYYAPFAHLDGERLSKTSFACFSMRGHKRVFSDERPQVIYHPETGEKLRYEYVTIPDWCQLTDMDEYTWSQIFPWMRRGSPLRPPTEAGECGFVEANMKDHLLVFSKRQETAALKYATTHSQQFKYEAPTRAQKAGAASDSRDVFTAQDITAIAEVDRALKAQSYTSHFASMTHPERNPFARIARAKVMYLVRNALAPPPSIAELQPCPVFALVRQLSSPIKQKPKPFVHLKTATAWTHHTMTLYAACEHFPAIRALVTLVDGMTWRGVRFKRAGDLQISHKPLDETSTRKTIRDALWAIAIPGQQDLACPFSNSPHKLGKQVFAFVHSQDPRSVTLRCNGDRTLCQMGRTEFPTLCARQPNVIKTLPNQDLASLFTLLSYASVVYNADLLTTVWKWLGKAIAEPAGTLEHCVSTNPGPRPGPKRKVPAGGNLERISIR